MNEEPKRTENNVSAPSHNPAPQPRAGVPVGPGGRAWLKKVLSLVIIGGMLGVAGFLISPHVASSDSLEQAQQSLKGLHQQLADGTAARRLAEAELVRVKADLESVTARADTAADNARSYEAKLGEATKRLAEANKRLEQEANANQPVRKQLVAAEKTAASAKAHAEKLAGELSAAQEAAGKLGEADQALVADQAKLSSDLASQQAASTNLSRLLEALEFGDRSAAPPTRPSWPGEKPITRNELILCMGQPSVAFEQGRQVRMQWGQEHTASTDEGIVTKINGKPATRAALKSVATKPLAAARAPAPWRIAQGQKLHYADLASMFGRPERVIGTGKKFVAWWTVGAWARRVSATVAEGVVTEFDGDAVDPARCCELVRHRAQAYRAATAGVQAQVAAAQDFYERAAAAVGQELTKEARKRQRDGVALKNWRLAALDSVGTWIAQTDATANSMTLRAALDCTWTGRHGAESVQRRYVVVTMTPEAGEMKLAHCGIFAGRD